jgi:hypothetical protein
LTTRVEPPVAIATLPDGAEPQTAGDVLEAQFEVVLSEDTVVEPALREFVIVAEFAVSEPEIFADVAESEPTEVASADSEPEIVAEPADIDPTILTVFDVSPLTVVVPKIVVVIPERPILIAFAVVEPIDKAPDVRVSNPKPFDETLIQLANKSPFTNSLLVGVVVPIPTLLLIIIF